MVTTSTNVSGETSVDEDGKVVHSVDSEMSERIKRVSIDLLRKAGPGVVRRRLEDLVNKDLVGLVGADKVFFEAFGLRLKGVPIEQRGRVSTWFRSKLGKTSMPSMLLFGLCFLQSGTACTLIVKADRHQCERDEDCGKHGAAYSYYTCDKSNLVCVAPDGPGGASSGGSEQGTGGQAGGSTGEQAGGSFGGQDGGSSGGQAGSSLGVGGQDGGQDANDPETAPDANQNNDASIGYDVALSDMLNVDGTSPFVLPQYMLLNLAIGSQGGDPTSTVFPVRYEIDWVRVFQLL
jgi:hypothetical protein